MTIKEWHDLKEGDMVWLHPSYFPCPYLAVIKIKGGRKTVWFNLFGDAQFAWRPADKDYMLLNMTVCRDSCRGRQDVALDEGRRCACCKSLRDAGGGRHWCLRRKREAWPMGRCPYWMERNALKLSRKRQNNMNNTEIH